VSLAIESYAKPFARLLRADSLIDSVVTGRRAAAPLERHVRCCMCFERCQLSGVLCARWRLAACSHASYLGDNTPKPMSDVVSRLACFGVCLGVFPRAAICAAPTQRSSCARQVPLLPTAEYRSQILSGDGPAAVRPPAVPALRNTDTLASPRPVHLANVFSQLRRMNAPQLL